MKRYLLIIAISLFALTVFGCAEETSTTTTTSLPVDTVAVTTKISFYKDINGEEKLQTDVFPTNKNIYIYVEIMTSNITSSAHSISLEALIPRSETIEVRQSQGPISAVIRQVESITGEISTEISGINFLAYPGPDSQLYIFVVQGISEGSATLQLSYEGYIRETSKAYTVNFQFSDDYELEQYMMPFVSIANNQLVWTHDKEDIEFMVSLKKGELELISNSVMLSQSIDTSTLGGGDYILEIKALGDGIVYSDSNVMSFSFTKLSTPVLTLANGKVTWEAVENVSSYIINFNGSILETTNLEFDVPIASLLSTNTISVIAYSNQPNILNSQVSLPKEISKLPSPVIQESGLYITWQTIIGASWFEIYINGVFHSTVTTSTFRKIAGGTFSVKVIAVGNHIQYYSSNESNVITYQLS
jgi:hypothetical protein